MNIDAMTEWERQRMAVVRDHLRVRLAERAVPTHLHAGLVAYVTERREPGRFLRSVLENNLREAVMRMSPPRFDDLRALLLFLFSHVPDPCWGDVGRVQAWLEDDSVPDVGCD
jgi:hypothetical protein